MTDYTISGFSSTNHGSTHLGPFDATSTKFTSFNPWEEKFIDPAPGATQGTIDSTLGTNAYKIVAAQGYGDGSKLSNFLNTNARYDVVNLRLRSTAAIDTNNRISIGGNRQVLSTGPGFALFTSSTGFAFYGNSSSDILGTLPTMNANTWYEITYVLDWSFAQRSSLPVVSLWVDGAIQVNQETPIVTYSELTGDEAKNFRLANFNTAKAGDAFYDDIRVACADTLPWGMSDAIITNPDNLMGTTYTGGTPYFVSLTAANEFTINNYNEALYGDVTVTPGAGGDVRPSSGVVYPRGSVRLD